MDGWVALSLGDSVWVLLILSFLGCFGCFVGYALFCDCRISVWRFWLFALFLLQWFYFGFSALDWFELGWVFVDYT